jgi:hypothetical protein
METANLATTAVDLSAILKGVPPGAWTAISERGHEVVAYGQDAQSVLAEAREKGELNPLVICIPGRNAAKFL